MRHRKSGRQLNRNSSHRQAMFKNMAASLIEHEVIKTTLPKAKELRRVAEPLITLAKEDSVANRRLAFSRTRDKAAVGNLFTEIGPRYADRPGGYTRILKLATPRLGDAGARAILELVGERDRVTQKSEKPSFVDNSEEEVVEEEPVAETTAEEEADSSDEPAAEEE